jgi:nucleoside-diphosphate-sugar epimerase
MLGFSIFKAGDSLKITFKRKYTVHGGMAVMAVILGLGFTGVRLARRLLERRIPVAAAVRGRRRFDELARAGLQLSELSLDHPEATVLPRNEVLAVLIPPLPEPSNTALHDTIRSLAPKRVVYVSSTSVYGDQVDVDASTPAEPNDERGRLRLEAERWIVSGPWSSLILRSAAIYGPGRGVHAAIREGKLPRSAGSGIISRIHAEDLAAIVEAGMLSDVQGAWPVADDEPCSSAEIARWFAEVQHLQASKDNNGITAPSIGGRRVDGRQIRQLLAVELKYASWKAGILASLAEEDSAKPG